MEDQYTKKYNLLLEKYMEIDSSNEKLQNRICHIRKQIRYLRRLKRLLIQKLVVFGDRFMDVCLEIPDMEPGANVEDQIIRRVAEVPHPPTPPHPPPTPASRSSTVNLAMPGSVSSTTSSSNAGQPAKKRRRTTTTQDDGGASSMHSPTLATTGPPSAPVSNRPATSHRKAVPATPSSASGTSSTQLKSHPESIDGQQPPLTPSITTPTVAQPHQVSASVEDVVNSVVFDCQQRQGKESEGEIKEETAGLEPILSAASISTNVNEMFHLLPKTDEAMAVDEAPPTMPVMLEQPKPTGMQEHVEENVALQAGTAEEHL